MMFQIQVAEKLIEIHSIYDLVFEYCEKYVISSTLHLKPDIIVDIKQEDIKYEYAAQNSVLTSKQEIEAFYQSPAFLELTAVYRKIVESLLKYNIILIHGSVVSTANIGYMFSAPQGIGKTTRTRLWIENIPESIVVNGDKPLIKVEENSIIAYGTPWSGKERWNHNLAVPLRTIFYIQRNSTQDSPIVEKWETEQAFLLLLKQTYLPADSVARNKTLILLKQLSKSVDFYFFKSLPTSDAIRLAYETANPKV